VRPCASEDVLEVVQAGRIVQHTPVRARRAREVGKAYGLGVMQYVGSIIEIEAAAFPAREKRKGAVRFNDTAGRWRATPSSTRPR
jgi:ATP-dependent Lon protease